MLYVVGDSHDIESTICCFPHAVFGNDLTVGEDGVNVEVALQRFVTIDIGNVNVFANIGLPTLRHFHHFYTFKLRRSVNACYQQQG